MVKRATYRDVLKYLNGLAQKGDARLDDTLTVRDTTGEYYPAELLEFNGDDILDDGALFVVALEWNEELEETEEDGDTSNDWKTV